MLLRDTAVLYRGYGAHERVFIQGRALERYRVLPAELSHGRWRNLRALLHRVDASPLPHATVEVAVAGSTREYEADDEGFFSGWHPLDHGPSGDTNWLPVESRVLAIRRRRKLRGELSHGEAWYPVRPPEHLIVSDIDDTVLQSQVTNMLRALRTLAFGNARTRLPFPGVAAFYHALRVGPGGGADNPLFYVSSSPWNLYDMITEFLDIQAIPKGPVMLRDLDLGLRVFGSRHHHDHKGEHIRQVLHTYPNVPVVLIGDSGQQDPEIYHGIVHEFAGRVSAVYIRNVTMNPGRSTAIDALAREVVDAGSSLVLADDTLAAARHAVEIGLIPADSLPAIGEEKRADER